MHEKDKRNTGGQNPPNLNAELAKIPQVQGFFDKVSRETKELINSLAETDFLHKDKFGKTVIDHLLRVANDSQQKGFVEPMVERLLHYGTSTQGTHGSCGAETINRIFQNRDPGEWARVAADLVLTGQSELRFGQKLRMPEDINLPDKNKSRERFDAVMQGALMNAVAPAGFVYKNSKDGFKNTQNNSVVESGTSDAMAKQIIEAVSYRTAADGTLVAADHKWVTSDTIKYGGFLDQLVKEAAKRPCYIVLEWPKSPKLHAVMLEGAERDAAGAIVRVKFSNPHGQESGAKDWKNLVDPPRRIDDNRVGLQSMSVDDFMRYFSRALVQVHETEGDGETDLAKKVQPISDKVSLFELQLGGPLDESTKSSSNLFRQFLAIENFEETLQKALSMALDDNPPDPSAFKKLIGDDVTAARIIKMIGEARNIPEPDRQEVLARAITAIREGNAAKEGAETFSRIHLPTIVKQTKNNRANEVPRLIKEVGQAVGPMISRSNFEIMVTDRIEKGVQKNIEGVLQELISKSVKEFGEPRGLKHTNIQQPGWYNSIDLKKLMAKANKALGPVMDPKGYPTQLPSKAVTAEQAMRNRAIGTWVTTCATLLCFTSPVGASVFATVAVVGFLYTNTRVPWLGTDSSYSWEDFKRGNNSPKTCSDAMRGLVSVFNSVRGDGTNLTPKAQDFLKELFEAMQFVEEHATDKKNPKGDLSPEIWGNYAARIERANNAWTRSAFWRHMGLSALGRVVNPLNLWRAAPTTGK